MDGAKHPNRIRRSEVHFPGSGLTAKDGKSQVTTFTDEGLNRWEHKGWRH